MLVDHVILIVVPWLAEVSLGNPSSLSTIPITFLVALVLRATLVLAASTLAAATSTLSVTLIVSALSIPLIASPASAAAIIVGATDVIVVAVAARGGVLGGVLTLTTQMAGLTTFETLHVGAEGVDLLLELSHGERG